MPLETSDRNRLVILTAVAIRFAGVDTDPSTDTGEGIFFQESLKGLVISALVCEVNELGDRVSRRAAFLARGCHERSLGLLKAPFPRLYDLRTSVRNRNDKLRRMIGVCFQSRCLSGSYTFTCSKPFLTASTFSSFFAGAMVLMVSVNMFIEIKSVKRA